MNAEKKNFYGWILLVAIGIMFLCSSGFILVGASVVNPLMMADSSMNMNATLMGLGFTLFVLCQGIVVCYKIVPDEEGIAIKADRSVDVSGAQWSLGEYDLEALEAAVQLRDSVGGKVTVLTVGGDEVLNSKLKKSILSRGADDQIVVCSEAFANLDAYCTAEVLARALGSTEYDLVLCGEGSSDMYSQQVGMILGQMLGLPVFNAVSSIAPAENGLLIGRSLDDCEELIEITLPAVLSAAAGIATPRIPSMKDILAGGKKPQIQLDGADIKVSAAVRCVRSTLAPESTERKQIVKEGDSPENIEELAAIIRREL